MESAEDRPLERFLKGENGRFRVIAAKVAAAPMATAALVINSRLFIGSPVALSDISVMGPSQYYGCETSSKLALSLLTNHNPDCTLPGIYFKVLGGKCAGSAYGVSKVALRSSTSGGAHRLVVVLAAVVVLAVAVLPVLV